MDPITGALIFGAVALFDRALSGGGSQKQQGAVLSSGKPPKTAKAPKQPKPQPEISEVDEDEDY